MARKPEQCSAPQVSPAKTAAERKADERQLSQKPEAIRKRRERANDKAAGRVPVTVNVLPEYGPEVRALEAKLQRRERKQRGPAP